MPVAKRVDGERYLNALKLGLVPYFTKDLQKARKAEQRRSETVSKSGTFREAFAKRRCLVPAPVYYEWRDYPDGKTVRRLKWAHSGDHAIDGGGMSATENGSMAVAQATTTTTDRMRGRFDAGLIEPADIANIDLPIAFRGYDCTCSIDRAGAHGQRRRWCSVKVGWQIRLAHVLEHARQLGKQYPPGR